MIKLRITQLLIALVCTLTFAHAQINQQSLLHISNSDMQKQVSALQTFGKTDRNDYMRTAWSDAESLGMEYMRQEGEKIGLVARYDGVGNLYLRTNHQSDFVLQTGSHMDSVPHGGTFDGGAGLIAGLEAIRALSANDAIPKNKDVELVIWRGEESATFQMAYKGSKAAFGDPFPKDALQRQFNGQTLKQAIHSQGFDSSWIKDNRATLTQKHIDAIKGYIELHIEQSKKLEADKKDIGIVTSIRGGERFKVVVRGEFDHSGATPMGIPYRHDANLTLAYIQVELNELLQRYVAKGFDLVQTVGVVNSDRELNQHYADVYKNALTKVSGFGYLFLDIRSNNLQQRDEYLTQAYGVIHEVANKFQTNVTIDKLGGNQPLEQMSPRLMTAIEDAAHLLKYSYELLPSGAGHDAAIVAAHSNSQGEPIPVAMIFVPSHLGKSHEKAEYTSTEQIRKGAEVLANALNILLHQ